MGFLDLEKHFAFYGAYHKNPINITIHMLFVWPIFFTAILLFNFIPTPFNLPQIEFSLFGNNFFLIFNFGFLLTLIYAVIYVCFDYKVGILAALLCFLCWVGSSVLGTLLGFQFAWKVFFFLLNLMKLIWVFFLVFWLIKDYQLKLRSWWWIWFVFNWFVDAKFIYRIIL